MKESRCTELVWSRVSVSLLAYTRLILVVADLGAQLVAPYKLEDETVNQQLELAIGDSVKAVNMDRVSNAEITPVRLHHTLPLFVFTPSLG